MRTLNPTSFALGLVESFLYGLPAVAVCVPIDSWLSRRLEGSPATGGARHA